MDTGITRGFISSFTYVAGGETPFDKYKYHSMKILSFSEAINRAPRISTLLKSEAGGKPLTLMNVSSLQQVQRSFIFGVMQQADRVTVKVFAGLGFLCFIGRGFFCTTALHVVDGDTGESTDSVEPADDKEPAVSS